MTVTTDLQAPSLQLSDQPIPFELSIGVTGHRDLEDPAAVSALVLERLEAIRRRFQADRTTPVKVIVYSALAEGADRIVVNEARRIFPADSLRVRAVLPLPADDYENDFENSVSRDEFRRLLPAAEEDKIVMPPAGDRDEAYQNAGRWIVDRSDLLIAIWDGRSSSRRGGTAATVEYARNVIPASLLVVPAARTSEPGRPVEPATPVRLALRSGSACAALKILRATERMNKLRLDEEPVKRLIDDAAKRESLITDPLTRAIHARAAAWSVPLYARADALAIRYQHRHQRLSMSLFLLAALAVTAVAAQLETGVSDLFALVEVGLMLTALGVYVAAVRLDDHDRWLGYRSLAEEFRAGLFLSMTGVEGHQPSESADVTWHQRVFSMAWQLRPPIDPDQVAAEVAAPGLQQFLLDAWITVQIDYHDTKQRRLQHEREGLRNAVLILFALTVLAGLMHTFEPFGGAGWRKAAIFLAIALPGWGAALSGIRDQRQHHRHEGRAEHTLTRLIRLRDEVPSPATAASVRNLASETRRITAEDSSEWSGVEEFQDLELAF